MLIGTFKKVNNETVDSEGNTLIDVCKKSGVDPDNSYFFLAIPETDVVASEPLRNPFLFSFSFEYKLYAVDSVPDDLIDNIGIWYYTGDGFKEWFNINAWRARAEESIFALKIEYATGADWVDIDAVRNYESAVRNYPGYGDLPVLK